MNLDVRKEVRKLYRDLRRVLSFSGESPNMDFFISSLTEYNPFNSTEEIIEWLQELNRKESFHVETIPLAEMRNWSFEEWTGDLRHESGGFFSIRGLKVITNMGPVKEWTQPIIDQPEIGVLGIITKKINGILYLLMQAKVEPGNIIPFQVSPTVQATRSNYMQIHGGKPTQYLEYFMDESRATVLVDHLQSEQGARFYRKRNRNIIVRIRDEEDINPASRYRWMTLGQVKHLMRFDNTVNMDARSVISNISYDPEKKTRLKQVREDELCECLENSPLVTKPVDEFKTGMAISGHSNSPSKHNDEELLHRLSRDKFNCELITRLIPLNEVRDWRRSPNEISHVEGKFFSVIGLRISAADREVHFWDQPIVKQVDPGIVGFFLRELDGVMHFLVQLKMESGNMDLFECAPTVQCITGSYQKGERPRFVSDILQASEAQVILDTMQSEEGGRFYREANRNIMLRCGENSPIEELPLYHWMNMKQLKMLLKFNNSVNVESRSLLAMI